MVNFDFGTLIDSMRINTPIDTEYDPMTANDIDALLNTMYLNANPDPCSIYISPHMYHRIWRLVHITALRRHVMPRPQKRRLRKVVLRRLQRRLKQGTRRIDYRQRVIERNEPHELVVMEVAK
jgi:hypothetical protein